VPFKSSGDLVVPVFHGFEMLICLYSGHLIGCGKISKIMWEFSGMLYGKIVDYAEDTLDYSEI